MLEKIKYRNDEKISFILTDINVVKLRTKAEIRKLIDLYKKSGRNDMVYELIMNSDLLNNRNNEEQIALINGFTIATGKIEFKTKEILRGRVKIYMGLEEYNKYIDKKTKQVFRIITESNILKYRTFEEQLELIAEYLNADDLVLYEAVLSHLENFTYDIIMSKNILNNFNNQEQLNFIHNYSKLEDSKLSSKLNELLQNKNLFIKRTSFQIDTMLSLYLSSKDENIYKIIVNDEILLNKTYKEQLELMDEYQDLQEENKHESNDEEIDRLNNMKKLLQFFQQKNLKIESLEQEVAKCKK